MPAATRFLPGAPAARGFTLIELIAVLVLAGLLLAFAPLSLDWLVAERELESEASRLGNMVEFAHQQALLDQAPYAMHYDLDENMWALQAPVEVQIDTQGSEDAEPRTILRLEADLDYAELDWHRLPRSFRMKLFEGSSELRQGRYRIEIDPNGTVPAHSIVLESERIGSLNDDDRMRTVKVNFPGFVSYAVGAAIDDFKKTDAELGR